MVGAKTQLDDGTQLLQRIQSVVHRSAANFGVRICDISIYLVWRGVLIAIGQILTDCAALWRQAQTGAL